MEKRAISAFAGLTQALLVFAIIATCPDTDTQFITYVSMCLSNFMLAVACRSAPLSIWWLVASSLIITSFYVSTEVYCKEWQNTRMGVQWGIFAIFGMCCVCDTLSTQECPSCGMCDIAPQKSRMTSLNRSSMFKSCTFGNSKHASTEINHLAKPLV